MWNVWHGSKLERRLFGNKGEKQPLLSSHQGKHMFALAQWLLTWLLLACVGPIKVYEVQPWHLHQIYLLHHPCSNE